MVDFEIFLKERKNRTYLLKLILVIITIFLLCIALINNFFAKSSINIFSFIIIHFSGYLFFLFLPVEVLFYYYLYQGFNPGLLFILAILTALLAQGCDYILGFLASKNIKLLIKPQRYGVIKGYLDKYGILVVFIFNLSILSSPVVALIAGITKMSYKKVLIFSFLGLSFKYMIIILVFYLI